MRRFLGNAGGNHSVKIILLVLSVSMTGLSLLGAEIKPIHRLSTAERAARQQADAAAVLVHRAGLSNVMVFVDKQTELFPITKPKAVRLLRREEKEIVWQTWQRFLDYTLVLDSTE